MLKKISEIIEDCKKLIASKTELYDWSLPSEETHFLLDVLYQKFEYLRKIVSENKFSNIQSEIYFFKELKPQLLSKLLYLKEIYVLDIGKPMLHSDIQKEYYLLKAKDLKDFFNDNLLIYQYYRSKATHMDEQYFLRNQFDFKHCLGCINFDRDPKFSTCYDHKFAMIMCYDMLGIYIEKKLHSLDRMEIVKKHRKDLPEQPFKWTDTKTAVVELGYAIYAKGSLNNGNADIKEIMTYLEAAFDVDLEDYYRTFHSLKNRKKKQTVYIDSLKEALQNKIDYEL